MARAATPQARSASTDRGALPQARSDNPQYYENTPWIELFDFTDAALSFTPSSGVVEDSVDPITGRPALKWSGMDVGAVLSGGSFTPTTGFTLDDIKAHPIRFNVTAAESGTAMHINFGMTSLAVGDKRSYFFTADQCGVGANGLLTHFDIGTDPFNTLRTWSGTGDTSLTVDRFSILLAGNTTNQVLYFSPMEYGGRSNPKIMFGIDNHSNSFGAVQSTILPDMQALNWPGYMAWSSGEGQNDWVGETDLADSLSMVYDDSWTVCNHSLDHVSAADLDSNYAAEGFSSAVEYARQQYLDNAAIQVSEGFPAEHVYKYSAQPENGMTANLKTALDGMGFLYSRSISPPFIESTTMQYNPNWSGCYSIVSKTSGDVPIDAPAIIDYVLNAAKLLGCSINFFSHGVHDTQGAYTTTAHWDYFIAAITKERNDGWIDLVSVDEWYKGLTNPRIST